MIIFALLGFLAGQAQAAPPMNELPAPGVYVNAEGSPLLPLLKNAKGSVDIEIYTMNNLTVRKLIREDLARGVRVRIIKDPNPLGEKCNPFGSTSELSAPTADCLDQRKLVTEIRAGGGSFIPFNKKALCPNGGSGAGGCYEHGKIALTDGIALLSTGNFDSTNLCIAADKPSTCDRDYTLIINDPLVVKTLEKLFEADLRGTAYDVASLIPASLKELLTVSPNSLAPLVDFINSARSSIDLEAQYLKNPQLNAAIEGAAKRGVKVSITVASVCAFGRPTPTQAKQIQTTYAGFDGLGISSKMFNATNRIDGKPGYMHAKAIVVDDRRAWLGSENGSTTSLTQNREYGFIFDELEGVRTILDTVSADHSSADSESWEQSLNCEKDSGGKKAIPGA
jgi:phosphatidylserine/phosphatidylglycerophosphate/cardiolipin synthase-like enzyme